MYGCMGELPVSRADLDILVCMEGGGGGGVVQWQIQKSDHENPSTS